MYLELLYLHAMEFRHTFQYSTHYQIKITVLVDAMPLCMVYGYWDFRKTCYLHIQRKHQIPLKCQYVSDK
jgi:hypothetical protein